MAARSSEERTALKFLDAFGRFDFDAERFAYYITRAGYNYQFVLWRVVKHIIVCWTLDLERGEDKGNPDYLRQTIHARQILDLIEKQEKVLERQKRKRK
jgi:hypothetical protein